MVLNLPDSSGTSFTKKMTQKENALGVYDDGGIVYLFFKLKDKNSGFLSVELSSDGQNFRKFKDNVKIFDTNRRRVTPGNFVHLNISKIYDNYFLCYQAKNGQGSSTSC